MEYTQRFDGDEFEIGKGKKASHMIRCCDCSLVHKITVRIKKDGKITLTAWRDNRKTAAHRRKK